ncbi:MAG: DUF1318 domain-containing protein [Porphyrobacter sp.]|nr:DUF1318 domain-containing protein [Porphyrobacter sp.]
MMRNMIFAGLAGAAALGMVAAPALAQRDPAYEAARKAGTIGEKPDGYLGIVGSADPALQRLVDNINIKRKAIYIEKARENSATPEAYALTAGCQAIARTVPGEKYMAPDGSWQTRTASPPIRDPRCP